MKNYKIQDRGEGVGHDREAYWELQATLCAHVFVTLYNVHTLCTLDLFNK